MSRHQAEDFAGFAALIVVIALGFVLAGLAEMWGAR